MKILEKIALVLLVLVSTILISDLAYAESISIESNDSVIQFTINDNLATGRIIYHNEDIEFEKLNVIQYQNKFFIFDDDKRFKIFFKEIKNERYLVVVKMNIYDSKYALKFIALSEKQNEKPRVQRDLLAEMNAKMQQQEDEEKQKDKVKFLVKVYNNTGSNISGNVIIPNDTSSGSVRDSDKMESLMIGFKGDIRESIYLNDNFFVDGKVYNVRNNTGLFDVSVNVQISRNDFVIREQFLTTGIGGSVNLEFQDMTYPEFYPKLCYDVKIIMSVEDKIEEWVDDFVINYPLNSVNWEPDVLLLNNDKWNHLPSDFRYEPRQSYFKDERCN